MFKVIQVTSSLEEPSEITYPRLLILQMRRLRPWKNEMTGSRAQIRTSCQQQVSSGQLNLKGLFLCLWNLIHSSLPNVRRLFAFLSEFTYDKSLLLSPDPLLQEFKSLPHWACLLCMFQISFIWYIISSYHIIYHKGNEYAFLMPPSLPDTAH